jgi:hypothetical protein
MLPRSVHLGGSSLADVRRSHDLGRAEREGWIVFTPTGSYKFAGSISRGFWYQIGLCRFAAGELDPYLPSLRSVPLDEPFSHTPWIPYLK